MYAANVVDDVCQTLLGENLARGVTPPVRNLLACMPEQVAIDHGNCVEKIGRAAFANEFAPLRRISAVAGQGNADFPADIGREPLGMIGENPFAKQRSDAVARSAAVLREVCGTHVQTAESFPRHSAHSFKSMPSQAAWRAGNCSRRTGKLRPAAS